jgi:hypothetical protein
MKYTTLLLSSFLLVACGGGGGGGGGPVASTDPFSLKQAYANDFNDTAAHNYGISGSLLIDIGGTQVPATLSGNGSVTQIGLGAITFEGLPARAKTKTFVSNAFFTSGGITLPTVVTTTSVTTVFLNANNDLVGFASPPSGTSTGSYSVPAGPVAIPVTAFVGSSGTIGTFNTYVDVSKTTLLGTNTISYAVLADTASTAILNLTQVLAIGGAATTQVDSYRLTPSGGVTRIKQTGTVTGIGTSILTY